MTKSPNDPEADLLFYQNGLLKKTIVEMGKEIKRLKAANNDYAELVLNFPQRIHEETERCAQKVECFSPNSTPRAIAAAIRRKP